MRSFACRLLVCAAALVICAVPAEAADQTFHPVANLSNSANRTSDSLDMATDGAHVYTVWREQVAPDAEELRFRVSNNHGASFGDGPGGRTILSVALPHRLFNVRIAAAGSTVLVLFSTGEDDTHAQFWVLRSVDGGASFPPTPFDVSGLDAAHQGDIAINAAGEAHIVMENVALGEIHHRRSTDAGATFSPATNISNTADVSGHPRVSVNGSNVAVVWEEKGPDGTSPADAAFAYSGDAGASFGSALNLSASAAPSEAPDVAFLDVIHVAWVEDGSVHYRRSADGSTFTAAVVLGVPFPGDAARRPAISGVGPLLNVAWTTNNPSGASDGPFLRRSENGGVNFSGALDLGPAGGPFDAVAIGGASPVKIAWPHSSSGSPAESDVLFLREIACSATWLAAVSDVWTNAARWSSGAVPGSTDDVCLTAAGSYTVTVRADQFANSVVVGAAGVTGPVLKIEGQRPGSSGPIPVTLTVGNGLTNFGRITLTSTGTVVSGGATVTVSSGTLTNASGGTIETLQSSQGGRTINATAVNDGTISFGWDSTLNGDWTNNNNATLASGRTLTLAGTAAFNQNNGSLTLTGTMVSTGGTFNYNGGEIVGTPLVLTSAALNIGPASTGGGTFKMRRDSTVSGNIASAQTLQIEAERPGSSGPINATLTASGDFINAGTIQLTSIGTITSGTAALVVPPGSVLTNSSTGRIDALQAAQGGRTLSGRFSNNGTVQVSWPMTIGGTNAIFTNNNTMIIDLGRTLSMAGSDDRFVQSAGTLDVNGTFDMVGGTFDFNGGTVDTTNGSAGLVILETAALNFGAVSTGAAHFHVRRISSLSGNIAAGQMVTIEAERPGSSGPINATVAASADFTNGGTIQLTSIGTITSGTATLAMAGSSVMTISSTGRIETLQGSQGGRVITGSFVNDGSVVVGWSVSLTGADATYTNNGSFVVNDGQTVSIAVASSTFVQAGGTLDIEGTVNMNGATFNFNGGVVDAGGGLGNLQNAVLNFGAGSTGSAHFRLRRNSTLTGNIAAGQTVTIEAERPGSSGPINATVTVIGNVTNAGTLQLTSIGTVTSGTATLTMADGAALTNAPGGRIETLQGSQGGRVINGHVVNNGTIVIGWSASLGGTTAAHTNNGLFHVQSSRTLSIAGDETFVQGGGTLEVDGTFHMTGATFNFNGGSVDASAGLAILESSALNFGPGSTGAAHLRVRRNSTLSGNIAAGQTVTIEAERPGSSGPINATVTGIGNVTNGGTIQLTSIGTITSGAATLAMAGNSVMTISSTGRIETLQGSQGGRAINGHVVNNGAIVIGWSTDLGGTAATHTNNGLFQIQASRTLSISGDDRFVQGDGTLEVDGTFHMTGATFNFNGGSVDASAGLAILESSALNFGPGSTGAAHLRVRRISTLSGNIAAGQTVTIEAERPGSSGPINATVTVIGNVTNGGTIQLTSIGTITSGTATLAIAAGAVLTNAATGRIETIQGSQGGRFVTGSVRNEGTLAVIWPATYSAGSFRNVSPGAITGGGNLTLANTSAFFGTGSVTANIFNSGQFNAGQSPGALSIAGNFTQTASGSLNVEIGGFTAGTEYDLIAISGTATLAGNLNVSLSGGFCEAGTFDVLTYPVVAGDFGTKNGLNQGGLIFTATRNATFYRLNATGDCVTAPIANSDAYSVNEDAVLNVAAPGVLVNDTDPQNTALTAILFTSPSHGEVLLNPNGSFTYTPAADFFGTDSFAYVANDGSENSAPATVTITVNAVNDPPNAVADHATVDEDSGQNNVPVLANDETAPDAGETLTITSVTQGTNGVVVITGGGSGLTYAPNANFSGIDAFTYTVSDGVFTGVATVNIQVNAINDPPDAIDDAATVDEDSGANAINVLTNDTTGGEAGETLSIEAVSQGANGVVAIVAGGTSVSYTPGSNFHGSDSFTYTVTDGNSGTDTAVVHVTVASVNDPPDAQDDAVSADEDSGANQLDVLTNDTVAPDGNETLQVTAVTQGANGSVAISAGGTSIIYTPGAEFSGSDSFTYTISDGNGGSDTATVTIVVNSVNDPPDAVDDSASIQEDGTANIIDVLANDTFAPDTGETLVITGFTQGTNGTVVIDEGWITYTPHPSFAGVDSFTYTISDGNGGVDTATVAVTINGVNDPPDANDDTATVDEDSLPTTVDVLANDSFAPDAGETLAITAVTQGANGSVAIIGGGAMVTYTPHADFAGSDSFTYTISDGNGGVDTATVLVTVNGVNDPPDANDDSTSVDEDSGATPVGVLANDSFAPDAGETLTITAVTQGANGSVAITGAAVSYTPRANFSGTDQFAYTVGDGHGGSDTATVSVTVRPVNDVPVLSPLAAQTNDPGDSVSINVFASDIDGDSLTFSASGLPPGTSIDSASGAITGTLAAHSAGRYTVVVTVDDGHAGRASTSFEWTIGTATDGDGDGVADDVDQCPGTPPGTVVNASGCAVSQICSATATWKNHGEYVSCVSHTATEFERQGLMTAVQRSAMVSAAATSDVGKK